MFDHSGGGHQLSMSMGSSPPGGSARETFLNYFFGQSGPGPIAGSSVDHASSGLGLGSGLVHHHPGAHQFGPGKALLDAYKEAFKTLSDVNVMKDF